MAKNSDVTGSMDGALAQALSDINETLGNLNDYLANVDPTKTSQSSSRIFRNNRNNRNTYRNRNYRSSSSEDDEFKRVYGSFTDELERGLRTGFVKSNFTKEITNIFDVFAQSIGVSIRDVPGRLGELLSEEILDAVKSSSITDDISSALSSGFSSIINSRTFRTIIPPQHEAFSTVSQMSESGATILNQAEPIVGEFTAEFSYMAEQASNVSATLSSASDTTAQATAQLSESAMDIGSSMQGASSSTTKMLPVLAIAAVALEDITSAMEVLNGSSGGGVLGGLISGFNKLGAASGILTKPLTTIAKLLTSMDLTRFTNIGANVSSLFEDIKKFISTIGSLWKRVFDTADKNLEYQINRVKDDVKTIVEEPFKILRQAAETVQQAWDANLRTISATQQYNKEQVQTLMKTFAEDLEKEGLSSVINAAELTNNLAKVLGSGLSGEIAEKFAYQATKLGAAIPTQDFFGYVEDYAVVFNSAIKSGKSQKEALDIANKSLTDFANNALFASRILNEGATTGLQNWSSLYEASVKIAQAANSTNISGISGALTAVSGYVGKFAPDLANSITDAVVRLATGGNDSSIVALRSMWGGNADNTRFLQAFAKDPTGVISKVFSGLGKLYTDSNDAFMEKAEAFASVFGVSAEAFQRVDWAGLSSSLSRMSTTSNTLTDYISLLQSGETTLTKEQLVNQKINEYMIEEGLSYVLDNEAARAIQQHMWDEQLARELQETTYGVNLTGDALTILKDIKSLFVSVSRLMNPFSTLAPVVEEPIFALQEALAQRSDLTKILELGKVGSGNVTELYGLTTTGQDLGLTKKYIELLGGTSSDWGLGGKSDVVNNNVVRDILNPLFGGAASIPIQAIQSWLSDLGTGNGIDNWLSGAGRTVSEFIDNVRNILGISSTANLSDYGINQTALEDYYNQTVDNFNILQYRNEQEQQRQSTETFQKAGIEFYDNGSSFLTDTWVEYSAKLDYYGEMILGNVSTHTSQMLSEWANLDTHFVKVEDMLRDYLDEFSRYFIKHEVYNSAYTADDVERIRNAEKNGTGDAILALAEALTANSTELTDPMVQTNALLAKILLVATTIMQQSSGAGQVTLSESLIGQAMGR